MMDPPTLHSRVWDVDQLSHGLTMGEETRSILKTCSDSPHPDSPNDDVRRILASDRVQANTQKWLDSRGKYLTASAMAGVLGQNKYSRSNRVYLQKTYQTRPFRGNSYTQWGTMHEAEAGIVYQHLTGHSLVEDVGLLVHPYEKDGARRYAATPDFITFNGILVEIKCPARRKIEHFVPEHYMAQLYMQMEAADINIAHFVQYRPHTLLGDGVFDIVVVERDPYWWKFSLPIFDTFWERVIAYFRKHGLQVGEYCEELAWKEPITLPGFIPLCAMPKICAVIEFDHPMRTMDDVFIPLPSHTADADATNITSCVYSIIENTV